MTRVSKIFKFILLCVAFGLFFLHDEKPELENLYGYWYSNNSFKLDRDEFPEVAFENSPQEVELKLVN